MKMIYDAGARSTYVPYSVSSLLRGSFELKTFFFRRGGIVGVQL